MSDSDHTKDDKNIIFLNKRREEKAYQEEYRARQESSKNKKNNQPILNIPPFTKLIIGVTTFIFLVQILGPAEWNRWMVLNGGFVPVEWWSLFRGENLFTIASLVSPITHIFLHGGWLHFLMNIFMLMAFGAGLEKTIGARYMGLTYLWGALGGVLIQIIFDPSSPGIMIGASGAISGLFGAILIVLQRLGSLDGTARGGAVNIKPFIFIWIGISVFFGLIGGPIGTANIAWAAHIGGFLAGLAYAHFLFKKHKH